MRYGVLFGCALALVLLVGCAAPEEPDTAEAPELPAQPMQAPAGEENPPPAEVPEPPAQRTVQDRWGNATQASMQGFINLRPRSNMTAQNRPAGPMSPERADEIIDELKANWMLSAAGADYPTLRMVLIADTYSLARLFSSEYQGVAIYAVDEASRRGDPVFVPFLMTALNGADSEVVAMEMVKAIETLAPENAQQLLRRAVSGESRFGRFAAALALAERRDDTGEQVLWQELRRGPDHRSRFFMHHRAARALLLLRKAQSKPDFDRILDPLPDTSDKRMLLPLVGEIGTPGAAAKLREYLKAEDHLLRKWSAVELGKLKDRRAVPLLIANLEHSSRDVRIASARALEQIGDPVAIPALKRAAEVARARGASGEPVGFGRREVEWDVMENAAFNLRRRN